MTTYFKATYDIDNKDFFLVALVDGTLYTSRKGMRDAYRMSLLDTCMGINADTDAKPATLACRTITKLDPEAEIADLNRQLEEANTRAVDAWRLFQMNTTATAFLTAAGKESLIMDAIRKQLNFLADPTANA